MGKEKPIWRLAFFSRLEERKGIKLFVDAINQLDVSGIPNFEVDSRLGPAPSKCLPRNLDLALTGE